MTVGSATVFSLSMTVGSATVFSLSMTVGSATVFSLSTVFHSINSPNNSPLSRSVLPVFSDLLVLPTIYLFKKVSLSPDIILCG